MKDVRHPREVAAVDGARAALVFAASDRRVTYAELVERSARIAQWLRGRGWHPGEVVAILLGNQAEYFEVCWAAHDAGLYYAPISTRLKTAELAYILADSGARCVFTSSSLAVLARAALAELRRSAADESACELVIVDGEAPGCFADQMAVQAVASVEDRGQGVAMMYSSGTTGRPKGIRPPLPNLPVDVPAALPTKLRALYGFAADTVYLSTAPLYHAAPLKFSLAVQSAGGTVVVMDKFDALESLACIERHRVTHSQWVPTMFHRLLRLSDAERTRFDLSTHRVALHSAAPCPIATKEQMLRWWGPIIHEYYGGSESIGMCAIGPEEWLAHKGSVGRATRGIPHIVDEQGNELPTREVGTIYFETDTVLRYHNDADKTARAHNDRGWATMGDVGYLDEHGYLYLTDRRDFVLISGGVNIYPQESEAVLAAHPGVADVAVFGVPDAEYGEQVKAVVVAAAPVDSPGALERELIEHCRAHLATLKCPKSIDFVDSLPREPTGKLLKKIIRQRYWDEAKQ